ncbi:hypothetical protein VKT23_011923 [Stygiomarasmius scandens]|uniref:Uncharacterized protein n=1 Tax=Marasmiellus scandens TaxID=2682957 RepID=A0ABR1J9Z8_9AGAR
MLALEICNQLTFLTDKTHCFTAACPPLLQLLLTYRISYRPGLAGGKASNSIVRMPDDNEFYSFTFRPPDSSSLLLSDRLSGRSTSVDFTLPSLPITTPLSSHYTYPQSIQAPLYFVPTVPSSISSSGPSVPPLDGAQVEAAERRTEEERIKRSFRYGVPLEEIKPIPPPAPSDPEFHWDSKTLSSRTSDLLPVVLVPNPIITPAPAPFHYPNSLEYTRNENIDPRFRRGYCYTNSVTVVDKERQAERLYKIVTPQPVEGMIQLPPGFPFAVILDNNVTKLITIACLQTMDSLSQYTEFPVIDRLVKQVWAESFGTDTAPPITQLGLKANKRSGPVQQDHADGSYSVGVTVGEGQGLGIVQPSSQVNTPEGSSSIQRLLSALHELWRLIVPLCVSKQEWDVWNFRAEDMNVYCPGGSKPAFTGCQINVSSSSGGGSLEDAIGHVQGAFHVDFNDDQNGWTLIMGLIRIPPGSAIGDFLLARPGLYARTETDSSGLTTFFLLFKGNDIHSGSAPKTDSEAWTEFLKTLISLYKSVGEENRIVYVMYLSRTAFHRSGGIAFSDWNPFRNNAGTSSKVKEQPHTFAKDGHRLKGYDENKKWLMREAYMGEYNQACDLGINLPSLPSYTPLLSQSPSPYPSPAVSDHPSPANSAFTSPAVSVQPSPSVLFQSLPVIPLELPASSRSSVSLLVPPSNSTLVQMEHIFDPEHHKDLFSKMRGLYRNLHDNNAQYYLKMKKFSITRKHQQLTTQYVQANANSSIDGATSIVSGKRKTRSQYAMSMPSSQSGADESSTNAGQHHEIKGIRAEKKVKKKTQYQVIWLDGTTSWVNAEEVNQPAIDKWLANPRNKRARLQNMAESAQPCIRCIDMNSNTYKSLVELLDPEKLADEYKDVQNLTTLLDTANPSVMACHDYLVQTDSFDKTYHHYSIDFLSDETTGLTVVNNLATAAKLLRDSAVTQSVLQLQQRSLNLAICRSIRFIYLWYTSWSKGIISQLFQDFISVKSDAVDAIAPKWSPALAQLAAIISNWVVSLSTAKTAKWALSALKVPCDLFGLCQQPVQSDDCLDTPSISYPPPRSKSLRNATQRVEYMQEVFDDLLTRYVIIPGIEAFDRSLNTSRRITYNVEDIKARSLLHGEVLEELVDWIDDDCLFASIRIPTFLASPASLLKDDAGRIPDDQSVARKILNGESPFAELGQILWEEFDWVAVLEAGEPLSMAVQDSIAKVAHAETRAWKRKGAGGRGRNKRVVFYAELNKKPRVAPTTELSDILPWEDGLRLDKVACILKETLHFKRDESGDPILRCILKCQHPTQNHPAHSNDPDHYNPLRSFNHFQRLLESSLGDTHPITSEYGLSNLLLHIGTGQGYRTEYFLTTYLNEWYTSAQDCIITFQRAWNTDSTMVIDNCRIWGSPASALQFKQAADSSMPDFEARIEPMFHSDIVGLWSKFCANIPHSQPTYSEALELAAATKIPGFKTGLTRMQLANSLVLLGVCQMPTENEMADIIHKHKGMGAFEGLQRLGLDVWPGCNVDRVRQAFGGLYRLLAAKLSTQDRDDLGFNPVFWEHFLCKVTRWEKAFDGGGSTTLDSLAARAAKGSYDSYPISLSLDRQTLLPYFS